MTGSVDSVAPPPIPWRIWKIAAVTGAGAFIALLDSTVANLALESIRVDLDATLPIVQWVVTGYLIALAMSMPAAGWLSSRLGYGRLWSAALAAFVATSVMCAVAPDPGTLIAGRFLKGLAAGLMIPAGQAVLGSTAGPKQLGRIMGTLGFVVALGPAVGPGLGGFLLEVASWRWLFWVNVPLGLAALVAARSIVPGGDTDPKRPLSFTGLALLGLGLPMLLFGGTEIGAAGVTTLSAGTTGLGGALTLAFIVLTAEAKHPLIDLRLLCGRTFAAATATTWLTGANLYGGLLLLPLYLQLGMKMSLAETGVMLLVMGLGTAVILPFAGVLTDRHGAGRVSLTGAVLLTVTTIPFVFADRLAMTPLIIVLVLRGMAVAMAQMPAMTAAYASVTARQMGDAATVVNIAQRMGGALGAIGAVIVLTQTQDSSYTFAGAFGVLLVISVATLIPTALLLREGERRSRANDESHRD